MLPCVACTCYLTSLGWGDVNVHVDMRHMHMLRDVTGLGGMLTFMLTCVTCTCYVTSLGWGDVNVHVNLRRMHMLPHVTGAVFPRTGRIWAWNACRWSSGSWVCSSRDGWRRARWRNCWKKHSKVSANCTSFTWRCCRWKQVSCESQRSSQIFESFSFWQ